MFGGIIVFGSSGVKEASRRSARYRTRAEAIVLQLPEGALGDAVVAFDLTWEATDKALALKQAA
jgi:hypothetical protein